MADLITVHHDLINLVAWDRQSSIGYLSDKLKLTGWLYELILTGKVAL